MSYCRYEGRKLPATLYFQPSQRYPSVKKRGWESCRKGTSHIVPTEYWYGLYIHVTVQRKEFLINNEPDALITQIYSVIKPYIFRASSLPIIRSFLLYIGHW